MKKLLFSLFVLCSLHLSAQKIYGTVFNDKGDLLSFSSISIKGGTIGTSANSNGKFSFTVSPGTYTVVCQHIGYTSQEKTVTVTTDDIELSFVLTVQHLVMQDVVIKSNREDPAYAIIRSAIKKRPFYEKQVKSFECDLYTKDILKLRNLPQKIFGQKIPEEDIKNMGLDSSGKGIVYLSESLSHIAAESKPSNFKMTVMNSRVSGSDDVGATFPSFISFYSNNVKVFDDNLDPRGFVSPISDGALYYYKYKYLGSFWEDGKMINSIRVIPKRAYEPLFSGVINISEDDWRIHSIDVTLTQRSQLQLLDTLQITQFHMQVSGDVWRVKNQVLHFALSQLGIGALGSFVSVYSNYAINPVFPKNYFDNIVIKYDSAASSTPKEQWDSIRPVPLEQDEAKDYEVKDSLHAQADSALDAPLEEAPDTMQGRLKLYRVVFNDIDRMHRNKDSKYTWGIAALVDGLEYNTVEGIALNVNGYFEKYLKAPHADLRIEPNFRYGFNNTHFNSWLNIDLDVKDATGKKDIHSWILSGGNRISQFNKDCPITPLINSLNTLFWGDNFMKLYENYFTSLTYSKKFSDGWNISVNGLYEERLPINNTTNFTFFKADTSNITPNYPYEKINAQFPKHDAFIVSIDLSVKPGQKYIQFPHERISLGSKWPLFSLNYTKGIKDVFGSNVDFDKWKLMISDELNLKLAGTLKYNIGAGGFINSNTVFIQDYQHFNGNRSVGAGAYLNSFQLAGYYEFSTTANLFGVGHIEHHFNGLLTNKIPLLKKLDWNLVAGSNALYISSTNNYTEVFVGLENIFSVLRVDFIEGYEPGKPNITGICIGTGGLLGNNIKLSSSGNGEKDGASF